VDRDLHELRHFHLVLEAELFLQRRSELLLVLHAETRRPRRIELLRRDGGRRRDLALTSLLRGAFGALRRALGLVDSRLLFLFFAHLTSLPRSRRPTCRYARGCHRRPSPSRAYACRCSDRSASRSKCAPSLPSRRFRPA